MKKILLIALLGLMGISSQAIQAPETPTSITLGISWSQYLPINEWWWGEEDRRNHYAMGTGDQVPSGIPTDLYYLEIWDDLGEISVHGGGSTIPGLHIGFNIGFPDYPDRLAKNAFIDPQGGTYEIVGSIDRWGQYYDYIVFTWSLPAVVDEPPVGVPDASSTVGLFGLALGGLFLAKRKFKT